MLPAESFVGLDLAWGYRARTGAAAVDSCGRLLTVASLQTDEDVLAWVDGLPPVRVLAVDAPLVVPNPTGMRECERLVARAFGRYGASCHVSNASRMPTPRAATLAARRWAVDARPGAAGPVCVEVYPHAALVGLFGLPYRLAYKKGPLASRLAAFGELLRLLERWPVLDLAGSEGWQRLVEGVRAAVRPVDLDRVEDEVDAVLCAGLALLHGRGELEVYGDPLGAHVVAPAAPRHAPHRPPVSGPR